MKTGHYLATTLIPLAPPFESSLIPVAANFDVLAVAPEYVLVRYEGIRVWKPRHHIEGNAVCTTEKVVADDGYRMIAAPVLETDAELECVFLPRMRRVEDLLLCA